MGAKSSYLRTQVIKATLKNTSFQGPATVYVGLHTGDPGLTGANEITGNGYARVAVVVATGFGAESGGQVASAVDVVFPAPTPSNWGTGTHFSTWDAPSGGNMLYGNGCALTNPVATSVGVPVELPAGSLQFSES